MLRKAEVLCSQEIMLDGNTIHLTLFLNTQSIIFRETMYIPLNVTLKVNICYELMSYYQGNVITCLSKSKKKKLATGVKGGPKGFLFSSYYTVPYNAEC